VYEHVQVLKVNDVPREIDLHDEYRGHVSNVKDKRILNVEDDLLLNLVEETSEIDV
jgi:hypothetical protein